MATEDVLVEALAEAASEQQYRVAKHKVTVDHEKEERRLDISFIQGDPRQGKLPLSGDKVPSGEEDD